MDWLDFVLPWSICNDFILLKESVRDISVSSSVHNQGQFRGQLRPTLHRGMPRRLGTPSRVVRAKVDLNSLTTPGVYPRPRRVARVRCLTPE